MMRGPSAWAVAVRKRDGDIAQLNHSISSPMARHWVFRLPVIRGVVALGRVARDRLPRARDLRELRGAGGR